MLHSIVIPVFNEVDGLNLLFKRMQTVLPLISDPCEVIFVNDGSKDGSAALLDSFYELDSRFKTIHFSRNFGHQAAITAGIENSTGDTVTVIDADMQDPPELIAEFIKKWREGYEVVYGVRCKRRGESFFKLITAKIFYRVIRSITSIDIPLDTGDFRLMDRKVVTAFLKLHERHRYIRGLISWVGFKQIGIPYNRAERMAGATHFPLKNMLKFAFDGIASFSFLPLRFATWLGFFTSVVSFAVLAWALYLKFFTNRTTTGWTSLISVVLFLGGAQLLAIGLIGEYIGRMFDEVRQRPLYLLSHKTGFEEKIHYLQLGKAK